MKIGLTNALRVAGWLVTIGICYGIVTTNQAAFRDKLVEHTKRIEAVEQTLTQTREILGRLDERTLMIVNHFRIERTQPK